MNENILSKDSIPKLFLKFCIPAIISMAIAGMQTMIDGMFVGNVIGPNGMASVNIASPYMQLIIGLSMIVSIGAQSYMGINLGEKNIEKAQDGFKTSIIFIIMVGSIISIGGFLFSDNIALVLGASDILLENVSIYIKTMSIFAIPMALMFLFGFSARIIEKPELYFKGMILSLIVNITMNYVLIYKLGLGMKGAAIATGLSYSSAFIIVVIPMLNKKNVINIFVGKFDKSTLGPILYNGSSEGINSVATATSTFLFNMAFMKIAGENGVAAFTAINYVAHFGTLLMFGVSDGIGPIVSYNYGAKEYDRVDSVMNLSSKVILSIGTIIFIALFFFGGTLVQIFMDVDNDILALASNGAKVYAFAFFMNGFNIVNSGYFTFLGKAKESVIVASSRGLIFIIIGIFTLPLMFGVNGIWMSIPFAELMTFIIGMKLRTSVKKDMVLI